MYWLRLASTGAAEAAGRSTGWEATYGTGNCAAKKNSRHPEMTAIVRSVSFRRLKEVIGKSEVQSIHLGLRIRAIHVEGDVPAHDAHIEVQLREQIDVNTDADLPARSVMGIAVPVDRVLPRSGLEVRFDVAAGDRKAELGVDRAAHEIERSCRRAAREIMVRAEQFHLKGKVLIEAVTAPEPKAAPGLDHGAGRDLSADLVEKDVHAQG